MIPPPANPRLAAFGLVPLSNFLACCRSLLSFLQQTHNVLKVFHLLVWFIFWSLRCEKVHSQFLKLHPRAMASKKASKITAKSASADAMQKSKQKKVQNLIFLLSSGLCRRAHWTLLEKQGYATVSSEDSNRARNLGGLHHLLPGRLWI